MGNKQCRLVEDGWMDGWMSMCMFYRQRLLTYVDGRVCLVDGKREKGKGKGVKDVGFSNEWMER